MANNSQTVSLEKSNLRTYLIWLGLGVVVLVVGLLIKDLIVRQLVLIFLVLASSLALFKPVSEALRSRQPHYSLALLSVLVILIFRQAWLVAALTVLPGVGLLLLVNYFKRTFHERVAFWLDNRLPLVRVLRLHGDQIVPFAKVRIGDRVLVRAGERIPVDGFLLEEKSLAQNAFDKTVKLELIPGDPISAGTLALKKTLVEASHVGADTSWIGLANIVQGFFRQMPKIYRVWAHRFFWAQIIWIIFVLGWLVISANSQSALWLAVAGLWWLGPWLTYLLSFNLITAAFKQGIIFKSWSVIESQKKIDLAVFDKTGTLTMDWMRVVDIKTVGNYFVEDVVRLAAALEQGIDHPISRTLSRKAREMELTLPDTTDPSLLLGFGVAADVDGETFTLCSAALVESIGLDIPSSFKQSEQKNQELGTTTIYLLNAKKVIAMFVLTDILRPHAKDFVKGLRSVGVRQIQIVSGDNLSPAQHIAKWLGVDKKNVWANLNPERKVEHVKKLVDHNNLVVGDPASDRAMIAAGQFGVGFLGRGPALNDPGSGVLIRVPDLTKIVEALKISGKLKRIWYSMPLAGLLVTILAALAVFLLV